LLDVFRDPAGRPATGPPTPLLATPVPEEAGVLAKLTAIPMQSPAENGDNATVRGQWAGRLWVVGAAVLWSSSGFFAKNPLFDDLPAEHRGPVLAFWRALFAALLLAPMIRKPRWHWGMMPVGIAFAVMNAAYMTAMSLTTAANAIWLQNLCPFWVLLFSWTLFRERVARREFIPLAFGILGVGMILLFEVQSSLPADPLLGSIAGPSGLAPFAGVIAGILSGVMYAGVVVGIRRLRCEDPVWLVAFNHAVAAVLLFPWVLRLGLWPSAAQMGFLACFGIVQMGLPYVAFVRGLRTVSSQEAVALGMIEPILVPFWSFLVRGEVPQWWTVVGGMLIMAGLLLRYVVWELWLRPRRQR
jgi:DME family drug/metabolite transporter